ncbi:unnamed protein product [Effrenium voratum]|uniref:Fungal lipase-type domain-containing protein n=1 Tax=Effrenium voratum TaxID=2562239 RepID=A0AA36JPD7_9DINO|nr:unnamed protein product [Effrenium voratum]CAJ1461091.1 unnamed protein product [Effrenium voratum]
MEEIKNKLMYWLALKASQWTYSTEEMSSDGEIEWSLDCGDGCIYTAKLRLRVTEPQFSSFDVRMLGGALPGEWRIYLLAFRGTVDLQDWITNLGVRVNWGPFANLMLGVHSGWHAAVSEESLHQKLKTAAAGLDHDQVLLAGHSMGAALAQMAMLFMWLESQSRESPLYASELVKTARCVIFGSPAPFVQSSRRNVSAEQRGRKAREWMEMQCVDFINGEDPVPRLPFNLMFCVSWLASFRLELPENVESELQSYEHLCRHIILGREETIFSFCDPADDVVRREEEGGRGNSSQHPLENYSAEMLGKLKVALAADSKPLLQMVSYRPTARAPDLGQSLSELQMSLSHLPSDLKRECLSPFRSIFASIQTVSTSLQNLQRSMKELRESSSEVKRLHNCVRTHLECIASTIRTANNYIHCDDWKMFERTMKDLQSMMEQHVLPAADQLAEAMGQASEQSSLTIQALIQLKGLAKACGIFTHGMRRAVMAVAGFVSQCVQLGLEYPRIWMLLAVLASILAACGSGYVMYCGGYAVAAVTSVVGQISTHGACATGFVAWLVNAAVPEAMVAGAACAFPVSGAAAWAAGALGMPTTFLTYAVGLAFTCFLACIGSAAVVKGWKLLLVRLLELAQNTGVVPLVELLHSIDTVCAQLGQKGYDAFMTTLSWFYDRAHEWVTWLQEELEQLKRFLETVGEKLEEAQGNCETVTQKMRKIECKTRELVSMACFITNQSKSPEEIEQKKRECRDMTQELLNETAEIEGRLGHGFALDLDPMLSQSFTQAVEDFFSSSTKEALQLRDEPASSSHEAGR